MMSSICNTVTSKQPLWSNHIYSILFNSHNLLAIKQFLLQYCYGTIIFIYELDTVLQYYSNIFYFTQSFLDYKNSWYTYTTVILIIFKCKISSELDHWEAEKTPCFLSRRLPPAVTWKYKVLNPLFVTLHHTLHSSMWHIFHFYSILRLPFFYVTFYLKLPLHPIFSLYILYLILPNPTVLLYILDL